MSNKPLIIAVPSKGRLKEDTIDVFKQAGLTIVYEGDERGYQGKIQENENIKIMFSSASEIAYQLQSGMVHLGVTGEDLIRETIYDIDKHVEMISPLGFGHADVIVAVPRCWLDVETLFDLNEVAAQFHRVHARRLRVATKYMMITRRHFAANGITGYRIVESLGATEGAPASEAAECIVDITSTGQTLKANHLKILKDGIILKSQANLVSSKTAEWSGGASEYCKDIIARIRSLNLGDAEATETVE
ncbi:MAG: ATP phosphoribosyltransferase [Methyloligellaceae bacterium]